MTYQLYFKLNVHLSHGLHSGVLSEMESLKFQNQFNNFIHELLILYVLINQQNVLSDNNLLKLHKNNLKHYGENIFKTLNQYYHTFFPLHSKKIKI